jgi:CheY-like chemotaxis protein
MNAHLPILVADDDEDDIFFLRQAMRQAAVANPLFVTSNGAEAIQYLSGEAPFADRSQYPEPGLFLLDLKMPMVGGFDVLEWMQGRPSFKKLPVVVLTSSPQETDRQKALQLGASGYLVKPSHPGGLVTMLRELQTQWLA